MPLFYDEVSRVLRGMSLLDHHCRFVAFSRNFGKEAGMYAGLAEAIRQNTRVAANGYPGVFDWKL